MPKTLKTIHVLFRQVLAPGSGVRVSQPAFEVGVIKTIQCHWPDGCNALVGIAVWYGNLQILPRLEDGYLALNDTTPTYNINQPISGEQIWVDMYNQDAVNPHTVSVVVSIEVRQ